MVTQLTTLVPLYSCNNNITMKMAIIAAQHAGEKTVNKIHNKYCSAFCWLFTYYGSV
jgi:hypothetical protein